MRRSRWRMGGGRVIILISDRKTHPLRLTTLKLSGELGGEGWLPYREWAGGVSWERRGGRGFAVFTKVVER